MHEDSNRHAYSFLTPPEVQFLDAAVERLIPADELGPGARDACVSYYIDRQLMSNWGMHGRNYRMGPWAEGTPQQVMDQFQQKTLEDVFINVARGGDVVAPGESA